MPPLEGQGLKHKTFIITATIIAVIVVAFLIYILIFNRSAISDNQEGTNYVETTNVSETVENALPTDSVSNPAEEIPTANPVEAANPFSDSYTNPFE